MTEHIGDSEPKSGLYNLTAEAATGKTYQPLQDSGEAEKHTGSLPLH